MENRHEGARYTVAAGKAMMEIYPDERDQILAAIEWPNRHKVVKEEVIKPIVEEKVYGTEVGNTCPICKQGRVEFLGGCVSCTECGAQLKCGI